MASVVGVGGKVRGGQRQKGGDKGERGMQVSERFVRGGGWWVEEAGRVLCFEASVLDRKES